MTTDPNAPATDLTKRELFAAMALQGFLAFMTDPNEDYPWSEIAAAKAVEYADALTEELNASQPKPAALTLEDVDAALREWLDSMPSPEQLRQDIHEFSLRVQKALEAGNE